MNDDEPPPAPVYKDSPLSHAAFLGWALGFMSLIALSVIGMAHSRQLRGEANIQFWVVVVLVAAALAAITVALARNPAVTRRGETIRGVAVGAAALGVVLFVWEAIALGSGAMAPPSNAITALFGA